MNNLGKISMIVLALGPLACGGSTGGGSASGTAGNSSPSDDARIDAVQAALAQPTEMVSPTTTKALFTDWNSFEQLQAAFGSILLIGADSAKACLSGTADAGVYDLSCVTKGQVQGSLSFEAHGTLADAGFQGRVNATLENACVGDLCVNADAVADIVPGDCGGLATLAVTATTSQAGVTRVFSLGVQGGMGRGQLVPRVVYFASDGGALMVDGEGGPGAPGPYLVTGANRSFECSLSGNGGQCSGATSFTF